MNNEEADDLRLSKMTQAMREADRMFESVGGSTRHHVRECLLPILKDHGLVLLLDEEVAALRTPPATGAAQCEACAAECDALQHDFKIEADDAQRKGLFNQENDYAMRSYGARACAAAIRALPAPEVPEAVRPDKCPKCGNSRAQAAHGVCPHPDCPMEGYQT